MGMIARPRQHETAWLWFAKIVTGMLIFALLMIHLVVNHLVAPGGLLTYADVLHYFANPLVIVMEGFFLVFVVSHALLGVRSIVLDFAPARSLVRALDRGLLLVGVIAIRYGLWLLITLAARAATVG
jgi:succinate dehydrogenase hydrophobic anchor subunit